MRWLPALLLVFAVPSCLVAQKTEADLRARLVDQPLYLRGQWTGDKLAFDDAGNLKGASTPGSFTLSGIEIQSIKLTSKELVLGGQRVGLEFNKDMSKRVGLIVRGKLGSTKPEEMTLEIERPTNGDFNPALDAIFTGNLTELVPQLPGYWQAFAQKHLLPAASLPATPVRDSAPVPAERLPRIGGGVSAPRLLTKVDPDFDETARAMKYSGVVLVNFVVDAEGKPGRFRILHPVGLGLDEQAIAAVAQYTFQPARQAGLPVTVELNVEVNFQIF
jgi:TonB family protein